MSIVRKTEDTQKEDFLKKIHDSDMILIGLGGEFDQMKSLKKLAGYQQGRNELEESEVPWMIPAWNHMYLAPNMKIINALSKLQKLISEKNYFVVSTSTNDFICDIPWKEKRLVMPCGGSFQKQCVDGCNQGIMKVTEEDWRNLEACKMTRRNILDLGLCPSCGKPLILNNVYTENYDEKGYLEQWGIYTKWLQGTLNKNLLIIELGVGLQYPSVIRFPFEKIGFYNQKAFFYRVNENLFQLTEDLKGKGVSIAKNAIEWLDQL